MKHNVGTTWEPQGNHVGKLEGQLWEPDGNHMGNLSQRDPAGSPLTKTGGIPQCGYNLGTTREPRGKTGGTLLGTTWVIYPRGIPLGPH